MLYQAELHSDDRVWIRAGAPYTGGFGEAQWHVESGNFERFPDPQKMMQAPLHGRNERVISLAPDGRVRASVSKGPFLLSLTLPAAAPG